MCLKEELASSVFLWCVHFQGKVGLSKERKNKVLPRAVWDISKKLPFL